jgi:elongator complex protein 3
MACSLSGMSASGAGEKKEHVDIEDIMTEPMGMTDELSNFLQGIVPAMISANISSKEQMCVFLKEKASGKAGRGMISNAHMLYGYRSWCIENKVAPDNKYKDILQGHSCRSQSGVVINCVFMAPKFVVDGVTQLFSCKYDCYFCPDRPDMPRSYLPGEPGVDRGIQNKWDPVAQFTDRGNQYIINGHSVDKIEVIVSGGTFSSYPKPYVVHFFASLFYSANTFYDSRKVARRPMLSLAEEQKINEEALCHIIGIVIETRPDSINSEELLFFRYLGVTRVQFGIQHTDDDVLYASNRGHKFIHAKQALENAVNCCFKTDGHIMLDMMKPLIEGMSNKKKAYDYEDFQHDYDMVEADKKSAVEILRLGIDHVKIYPQLTLPYTRVLEEYNRTNAEGKRNYQPYSHQEKRTDRTPLIDVIHHIKERIPPWTRLNRMFRDFAVKDIEAGSIDTGMRQTLEKEMRIRGTKCKCIRCREVKKQDIDPTTAVLFVRKYTSFDGDEYFISFDTPDEETLFGFVRLRLTKKAGYVNGVLVFPELENKALIRELHVYGDVKMTGEKGDGSQHLGFGRRLMNKAMEIAIENKYTDIAVIAGVGVRNYYRNKLGFEIEGIGQYMTRSLDPKMALLREPHIDIKYDAEYNPIEPPYSFSLTHIEIMLLTMLFTIILARIVQFYVNK